MLRSLCLRRLFCLPEERPNRHSKCLLTVLLVTFVLGIQGILLAQDEIDSPNKPLPEPILLGPEEDSFVPLDVEVDAFVRIPQARIQFNVDGSGLAIAVIDSGINQHHVSFQGQLIPGKNFSTVGNPDDTTDLNGHGSNVSGIIMGKQVAPSLGLPTGVAPGAHIIPLKVFPDGAFVRINDALRWVIDNRDRIKNDNGKLISVVNMSLGNGTNFAGLPALPNILQVQRNLIAQLRGMGVVVTVSAGNDYMPTAPRQGMAFPAICPETTSVGAIYDSLIPPRPNGSPLVVYQDGGAVFRTHPGRLTVFSQRLGEAEGGIHQTDIYSPGFIVTSAGPVPPSGSGQDPATTRSTQDGTSQASPVVAGVVLLLQQRWRDMTGLDSLPPVELVERCLRDGGVAISDIEDSIASQMDNVLSSGAINLKRVDAVSALTFLTDQLSSERQNLRNRQFELFDQTRVESSTVASAVVPEISLTAESRKDLDSAENARYKKVKEMIAKLRPSTSSMAAPTSLAPMATMDMQSEDRRTLEERIVGNPDFLPANFIVVGARRQAFVGRVAFKASFTPPGSLGSFRPGDGWGTGFLVTPTILMTNNHVLEDVDFSRDKVRIEFNYQRDLNAGLLSDVDSYDFDPNDFFYTNAALDFTLIRVKRKSVGGAIGGVLKAPGDNWGFYNLSDSKSVSAGSYFDKMRFNIVQHPDGRPKEIAMHKNHLDDLMTNFVRYTTDTEGGSSGSPVFDNSWRLMAVHHAAGALDSSGNWKNNQGVRIDKIIDDIESATSIPDLVKNELGLGPSN